MIYTTAYSLEEGGIGRKEGFVSVVNTNHFFYETNNLATPDPIPERFIAKLYADVSVSYPTIRGRDDSADLEQLKDGWQYNVSPQG